MTTKDVPRLLALLFSSAPYLPQPNGLIVSTTGNRLSIGAKGHRPDAARQPPKDVEAASAGHIPHVDHPLVVPMHQQLSVGAEAHRADDLTISLERSQALPALGIPMIGLFALAVLLRWWATSLLKEQWSSRVVVPEDLRPVTVGPYRVVRHPNYLAVSLELLAAGLMYSAFLSTAVVGALNLFAIVKRIRSEEEALFQIPAYRAAMASKARLIPGIY